MHQVVKEYVDGGFREAVRAVRRDSNVPTHKYSRRPERRSPEIERGEVILPLTVAIGAASPD